jgi:alkylated DNA repair dioxygenase AlkB
MRASLFDSGDVRLFGNFWPESLPLYDTLASSVSWDTRLRARMSASFGLPYNYSGIEWPPAPFPDSILPLLPAVAQVAGFEPTNCLANYYLNGDSTMGFHSDETEGLEPHTGIAVVSLGVTRTITFRRIDDKTVTEKYELPSGSLLLMSAHMQRDWKHAILADSTASGGRISLTFRRVMG